MQFLRWLAEGVAAVYLALAVLVLAASAGEGDGDIGSTLLVLAGPLVAVGVYGWGLARPVGQRGRAIRVLGWFGMVAGSVALISFSFIVWPLLLLALPYSLLRDESNGHS
jgi:hypothetical protein